MPHWRSAELAGFPTVLSHSSSCERCRQLQLPSSQHTKQAGILQGWEMGGTTELWAAAGTPRMLPAALLVCCWHQAGSTAVARWTRGPHPFSHFLCPHHRKTGREGLFLISADCSTALSWSNGIGEWNLQSFQISYCFLAYSNDVLGCEALTIWSAHSSLSGHHWAHCWYLVHNTLF